MFRDIRDETVVSALRASGFTCTPQAARDQCGLFAHSLLYETDFSGGVPFVFPDGRVLLDNGALLYWRAWLLLIGCSASKRRETGLLPAKERYTGVVYSLIHRARRERFWPAGVQVQIVSAEYGLIGEDFLLPYYDRLMTEERGRELQVTVGERLDAFLHRTPVQEVYINMGAHYRMTLDTSREMTRLREEGLVRVAQGGIGVKRKCTREWLCSLHAREIAERMPKALNASPSCAPPDWTEPDNPPLRRTGGLPGGCTL